MKKKTFTLQEAQVLLPVLESLLRRAIAAKKRAELVSSEFEQIKARILANGGTHLNVVDWAKRKAELDRSVQQAKDALAEIDAAGVQVKDLDIGLLDFPCELEDRTILLCWKMGEQTIAHWHGEDEGFAGRKPIDDRIANLKRKKQP
jgi:hypothetical protein